MTAALADEHKRTRPLRLIGYARVSTAAQGEQGHGLGAQSDELAQYAKAQGHELVHIITDVERHSGRQDDWPRDRDSCRRSWHC